MAAWAPHLGSVSHPHPGEEVSRLEHGLAARSFLRIRRTCIWLGDEANVKPLPLVDQKPEGPGTIRWSLKRGTGTGMELRALGAMLARVTATTPPPLGPGKNDQSGRVKTRIASAGWQGTTHGAVLMRPAPSSGGTCLPKPEGRRERTEASQAVSTGLNAGLCLRQTCLPKPWRRQMFDMNWKRLP
jgi:hypothetical protein